MSVGGCVVLGLAMGGIMFLVLFTLSALWPEPDDGDAK